MEKIISKKEAFRLCGGKLPLPGHEKLIQEKTSEKFYWIEAYKGKWYKKETDWKLVEGQAILSVLP